MAAALRERQAAYQVADAFAQLRRDADADAARQTLRLIRARFDDEEWPRVKMLAANIDQKRTGI
jgi:hypothetical protein